MGDMIGHPIQVRNSGKAFLCALAIGLAFPAWAQTDPTQPVPDPPPSVEDFSLPPGSNTPAPQPAPTGPVDDTSQPVPEAPTPTPTPPATVETQPPTTAVPTAPVRQPPVTAPAPAQQTRTPSEPQTTPAERQAPAPVTTETDAAPPASNPDTTVDETPVEGLDETADDVTNQSAPLPSEPSETASEQILDQSTLNLGIALALLILCGLGFFWWRRKGRTDQLVDEPIPEADVSEPVAADDPNEVFEEAAVSPTAEPQSPDPQAEPITEPAVNKESTGYVTTKISEPEREPEPPQPSGNIKIPLSDRLNIKFSAERASTTLMNAVVEYRIEIENRSEEAISNLFVTGTMIQADKNLANTAATTQGQLLNEIGNLAAGKSASAKGEIRLPLNSFQAIDFQSQKLLVPLVLLRFDYVDGDGNAQMQAANFLIGTEHEPPRAKMAPFRLDLGPRNFGNVAHRIFQG